MALRTRRVDRIGSGAAEAEEAAGPEGQDAVSLISVEAATTAIIAGFTRGDFEIHFPKRFTLWLKLLRLLPYRWYFALVHKGTGL